MATGLIEESLTEFEAADERLKQAISDYQSGVLDIGRLATKMSPLHSTFCRILDGLGKTGQDLSAHLGFAYDEIAAGNEKYVSLPPHGYHQVVWEAHRLLIGMAKNEGVRYYLPLFVGWGSKEGLPLELKRTATKFRAERGVTFLRTEAGWVMYLSIKGGGDAIHFTMVKKVADTLHVSISYFCLGPLDAVESVLVRRGFKRVGFKTILRFDEFYNYILDLEGPVAQLETLINVLYRFTGMATLSSGITQRKRLALIAEHVLENYIKNPLPWYKIHFVDPYVYWSDLNDILGSCSDDEAAKIIDELLAMPRDKVKRVMYGKYHFNWDKHGKMLYPERDKAKAAGPSEK